MDFAAYHNTKKMGEPLADGPPYDLFTNTGSPERFVGHRIWVIEGRGDSPKQFFLRQRFVVNHVEPCSLDGFDFRLVGREGIDVEIPLNDLSWFPEFKLGVTGCPAV
jgi:hypothetical protein